jgi:uncharacterized flavoprotein (TIGR03862 family)
MSTTQENSSSASEDPEVESSIEASPPLVAKTVAIIGAGPAGLIAAEHLAEAGHRVMLFDRNPTVGRKLLMAGRGGLNLTHSETQDLFLARYRESAQWLWPMLEKHTPGDLRTWCEGLGQQTFIGSSGRVFPKSMKTSPLLRAWTVRLKELGVQFYPRHTWTGWNESGAVMFEGPDGPVAESRSDAVLLALGGGSWPRLGSDAGWVSYLAKHKVQLSEFVASNCGVNIAWSEIHRERFAGQPLKGIGIAVGEESARGEAMITAYGLEGGGIYALSAAIRAGLASEDGLTITIDLRPRQNVENIAERLAKVREGQSTSNRLKKAVKLAPHAISLLRESVDDLPRDPLELATLIKAVPIKVHSLRPMERAISSAGGIQLDQIDDNLMLNAMPGVFVAGEMLDWEAPTGGYLLQASFSTGVAAAAGIQVWLE